MARYGGELLSVSVPRMHSMRCLICDSEMILMHVEPDDAIPVRGFEWRTFMCSACCDVERQLAFVKAGRESEGKPVPVHAAPSSGGQPTANEQPAPLAAAAASITGEQRGDEQPMPLVDEFPALRGERDDKDQRTPLMDAPSAVSGEQSDNEQLMSPMDAGAFARPPSAALEERPAARGLIGRVVAKMRSR
jgi:hypothetical protein